MLSVYVYLEYAMCSNLGSNLADTNNKYRYGVQWAIPFRIQNFSLTHIAMHGKCIKRNCIDSNFSLKFKYFIHVEFLLYAKFQLLGTQFSHQNTILRLKKLVHIQSCLPEYIHRVAEIFMSLSL